jgi:hypothetical protein
VPSGGTTNALPAARIVSITPNPATAGSSVSFSGAGSDSDGTVTAYEWRSDLAGVLSTAPSFSTSSLAAGTHTISFRVRDDKSAWSSAVQQSLAVNLQSPQGTRIVIDNGAAPTSFTGTWSVSTAPNAYGASSVFAKGSGKASYQFTLPAAGSYKVDAWWTSTSGRSPAVPIDIAHATGTSRVTVNQRSGGGAWNALGTFNFGTRATVTINVVDGYSTCADAISFTLTSQLPPPPAGSAVIIDNGAAGTSSTGTWSASTAPSPYGASSVYAKNGPTYTYTAPVSGTYRVYAWWTEWSSRGTAVPYTITHSSGSQTVKVNQQTGGGRWNLLGTFNFSGKATIKITAVGAESTVRRRGEARAVELKSRNDELSRSNRPLLRQHDQLLSEQQVRRERVPQDLFASLIVTLEGFAEDAPREEPDRQVEKSPSSIAKRLYLAAVTSRSRNPAWRSMNRSLK